jgi:hypothetical protein
MRLFVTLFIVCQAICLAQSTGKAETTAPCSPAISGNHNTLNLNCNANASAAKVVIDEKRTPKYRAINLDKELMDYFYDERRRFPEGQEGLEATIAALKKTYSTKFEQRVDTVTAELKRCGADTTELEKNISYVTQHEGLPASFLSIAAELSRAAYDIPGGQPQCGTSDSSAGNFRDKDTGWFTVKIGKESMGYRGDFLTKTHVSAGRVYGVDLGQMYVIDGHLYFDTTLALGFGSPTVTIKRNEIETDPFGVDHNFSDKAVEVVLTGANSGNPVPIFQMVYETNHQISISGLFFSPDRKIAVIVTPNGNTKIDVDPAGQKKIIVPLKPLFKYPSWQHHGEYAQ